MNRLNRCIKEPFPGISHWIGVVLAVAALVVLLVRADGRAWHVVGFAIYGASLIVLYAASATAHSVHCSPRVGVRLDRLDYSAIFLLIAGTYTPICLIPLRGPLGWTLFGLIWALAGFGIWCVWHRRARDRTWVRILIYLCMGWLVVVATGEVLRTFSPHALAWLLAGGIVYSIGAVIFVIDRPHLWPGRFTAHDLWHCLVLAASACHFMVMYEFITAHA